MCSLSALNLEASRRIGDYWKVELEARAWNGVEHDDPMAPLRRDDYVQLTLSRFFRALHVAPIGNSHAG